MSDKFTVEIISPDKSIIKTEANEVNIPSYEGEIGILKDHIPLITFLRPGLVSIVEANTSKKLFIEDGIVEFSNNQLLILSSTVKKIEDIEKKSIDEIISSSQKLMDKDGITDKEKYLLSYKIETLKSIYQ
tara:strand:+ start:3375 stop:3767 length:393 start_codon:yes stop_codon:yes gene_type:complete